MAGTLIDANEIFYTAFEPKLTNRGILYMEGIPSFMVKGFSRPSLTFETIQLDHINVRRKVAGKGSWNAINMTLYDPIVPSGAQIVMEWVRLHLESSTGRQGYSDYYKKDLVLNILGPVGDKVEEWIIKGAFINSVTMGDITWDGSGALQITLTVDYDYADLRY